MNSDDACPRCRASLHTDVARALCLGCGAAALHQAFHQRPARILAVLRQEDFSSFLKCTDASGDAPAQYMLGYAYDNGDSVSFVLNLSAFNEKFIERTEAFWEVDAVWIDAAEERSPQALAGSLKEAANLVIRRAGLTAGQRRQMHLCVRQQRLSSSATNDLEMRFGSLTYGVEVTEFLRGEMGTAEEAIGRVGQAWQITTLISEFKIGLKPAREAAIEQLVSIGGPAAPALIEMLDNGYWLMRKNAARTLGMIGDPLVEPALIENATCQYPLDRHLSASAVPALVQTLHDRERDVRETAAEALGEIGAPALPALIDTLKDRNRSMPVCAAIAFRKMGGPAMPALIAAFNHWDSSVRDNIAEVLGMIGDPAAVPALVDTLRNENNSNRKSVTTALKLIGDGHALLALKEADKKYHRPRGCNFCRVASELEAHATR